MYWEAVFSITLWRSPVFVLCICILNLSSQYIFLPLFWSLKIKFYMKTDRVYLCYMLCSKCLSSDIKQPALLKPTREWANIAFELVPSASDRNISFFLVRMGNSRVPPRGRRKTTKNVWCNAVISLYLLTLSNTKSTSQFKNSVVLKIILLFSGKIFHMCNKRAMNWYGHYYRRYIIYHAGQPLFSALTMNSSNITVAGVEARRNIPLRVAASRSHNARIPVLEIIVQRLVVNIGVTYIAESPPFFMDCWLYWCR